MLPCHCISPSFTTVFCQTKKQVQRILNSEQKKKWWKTKKKVKKIWENIVNRKFTIVKSSQTGKSDWLVSLYVWRTTNYDKCIPSRSGWQAKREREMVECLTSKIKFHPRSVHRDHQQWDEILLGKDCSIKDGCSASFTCQVHDKKILLHKLLFA